MRKLLNQHYGRIFKIMYGSGPVSGVLGIDDVTVGGVTAKSQGFAMVDVVKGLGTAFAVGKFDGSVFVCCF